MTRLRQILRAAEALLLLLAVTGGRRTVPMHRWARRVIGSPRPPRSELEPATETTFADEHVRRAVLAASRRSPIGFSCLDQAIAGALMLRRRGFSPAVVIGMPASDVHADSHAWLLGSCGAVVLGGDTGQHYVPVTVFDHAG